MAPDAPLVISETEEPYSIMDVAGNYQCPHCGKACRDEVAAIKGESFQLLKKARKNKKINLSLLVGPEWMKGAAGSDSLGRLGGTAKSDAASTARWNKIRSDSLRLIEVRGELGEEILCPETGMLISTRQGNIPKKSNFTCQENTCGRQQDVLDSIKLSGENGPFSSYLLHGFFSK